MQWVIVDRAHPALITEAEARRIGESRQARNQDKRFIESNRSRSSSYLLSGGLFKCGRCGANMTGFRTESGYYYVCGSQPYRSGMGCGPGVYVPQKRIEAEVIEGLDSLLGTCTDPKGFVRRVNEELRQLWASDAGSDEDATNGIKVVDAKIANIRQAIEDGLADANWANSRLQAARHGEAEASASTVHDKAARDRPGCGTRVSTRRISPVSAGRAD